MSPQNKVDVVIVGAGLSGLAAALELRKSNLSFVVLEARNRPGGRVYSKQTDGNVAIDFGAQWISPKHHRMKKLISNFGFSTVSTYKKGKTIYEFNQKVSFQKFPPITGIGYIDIYQFSQKLNRHSNQLFAKAPWESPTAYQLDQITMLQYLEKHMYTKLGKRYITLLFEEMLCSKLNDVSALDVMWCIKTAGNVHNIKKSEKLWIEEGAGDLMEAIASSLSGKMEYNCPVQKIAYNREGVSILTNKNCWKARRAIIAVPPNLQTQIEFEPPLPTIKSQLNERSWMPSVIKFIIFYKTPFWRKLNLTGMIYSENSVVKQAVDITPKHQKVGVLTVLSNGSAARHLEKLSEQERRNEVLATLTRFLGNNAATPLQFHEKNWTEDEWTRGGYGIHYAPGVIINFGAALFEPVLTLHWAGSETATEWRMYMEGAVQSGERAAKEVLNYFS